MTAHTFLGGSTDLSAPAGTIATVCPVLYCTVTYVHSILNNDMVQCVDSRTLTLCTVERLYKIQGRSF